MFLKCDEDGAYKISKIAFDFPSFPFILLGVSHSFSSSVFSHYISIQYKKVIMSIEYSRDKKEEIIITVKFNWEQNQF